MYACTDTVHQLAKVHTVFDQNCNTAINNIMLAAV